MAPHSPDSLAGLKVWCPGKGRKRRRDRRGNVGNGRITQEKGSGRTFASVKINSWATSCMGLKVNVFCPHTYT